MSRRAPGPDARTARGDRTWRRLLVEPARPAVIRDHPHAVGLAVASVCIGAFMSQLDASIVNLAYPALRADFGAGIAAVQWVGLSYLLVLVATITAVGRLADMIGHKLLYVYGFAVFTVGSILSATAPDLVVLDVFRGFQALGGAMMQANSVAIIARTVPRPRLGTAIGLQGAAQALGLGLGPAIGGLLVAAGGWRLVFLVNVPAGLVGGGLGWFLIPRSRDLAARVPFDWVGLTWFVPAVTSLLLALSLGSQRLPPLVPVGLGVVALVSATGFVRRERRAGSPMVDLTLFGRSGFAAGISTALASYLVLFGVLFVVPFFLEHVQGQGPGRVGLELTALPLAFGLAAPFTGRLADRRGPRIPAAIGLGISVAALVAMAVSHDNLAALIVELALLGGGLGAVVPANNAAVMRAAPAPQSGLASGILNTSRALGTALGVAVAGLAFSLVSESGARSAGTGITATVSILAAVAVAALATVVASSRSEPRAGAPARSG